MSVGVAAKRGTEFQLLQFGGSVCEGALVFALLPSEPFDFTLDK
jgi:hypothetical protein